MIEKGIFLTVTTELIKRIEETQNEALKKAADAISTSMKNGGVLHAFSTGHSHMIVEELFYRAGGLVQINPILEPALMLHEGALKSTKMERLSGYAELLFKSAGCKAGELIIIASNSGINAVPVEMALVAKQHGLKVIAVTSVNISSSLTSRHSSGKKLMDIADIVIDNCLDDGDAVVEIPGTGQKVGAVSSIAGMYIAQRLVINVINEYLKDNKKPPVYMSANIPGGDEHNAFLIEKYKERIRGLY